MATSNTQLQPVGNGQQESGSLIQEKVTYRTYVKLNDKGEIEEKNSKQEASAKNKDGLAKNWEKLEEKGYTVWNENEFLKYTVNSVAGFNELVPDEEQRVYIIQAGLNYVQNAKANVKMTETVEGDDNTPAYNGRTIDLKDEINKEPSKRSLTDLQKVERTLKGMNLSAEEFRNMMAILNLKFGGEQAPATAEQEVEEVSAE